MNNKDLNIGMYIINSDYKMMYINSITKQHYPSVNIGKFCYKELAGLDKPCCHCPINNGGTALFYSKFTKEWISAQAAQLELPGYEQCYNIHYQIKNKITNKSSLSEENDDISESISELAINKNECLIGGYCEDHFPLYYVNDNMIKLLGYDDKEDFIKGIDGMVVNTIHPDDLEQVMKDLGNDYYPGMTYETVYRMPRKDGTWFTTVDNGKVIKTSSGKLAIISKCMDMSGFIKKQGELLQKEFFNNSMMNNMPSGYHRCATTKGCPLTFISKNFEEVIGWTKEEIENEFDNLYQNIVWPEDSDIMQKYEKMKSNGNSYSTDIYRIKRKGGGFRWVLDSTMFVDLGENSYFQATLADITDFIENENKQKKQLEDAMIRIQEANNAKTKFLSSMSHDIRTPMNAIIGMTTLASKHLEDKEYIKKCLNKMALASNHLLTLVNDVLDISKVESGKMTLNPIAFCLSETVSNLVNIVRQQICEKCQKFDVRVHNIQEEYLFADELRLNQIFINILSNAVKYTNEGGYISMDLKQEFIEGVSDKIRVIYIVEDNGIGMSKEFQEYMYNSFSRANNENYGAIQGTGLGLTISKTMVNLMNGKIDCESELGKGTKFTVTLELPIAENPMKDLILPSMEVLLVDDDEIFLESASNTLMQLGTSPDCVNSGKNAIRKVVTRHNQNNDYPVIIIDWQMPDMNGIETIRQIRANVGNSVSIIVISAYEWHDIEALAKEAGADGFISKPFFPSNVYEKINRILGLRINKKKNDILDTWSPNIAGMNILVAEDNDLNWEIIEELLTFYHVETTRAKNGQECFDILNTSQNSEFDLVLMDIKMPLLDGYETTVKIRNSHKEYVKNIPIVAMTANAFSEDIQKCKDIGMNEHISKPINLSHLVAILETEYQSRKK